MRDYSQFLPQPLKRMLFVVNTLAGLLMGICGSVGGIAMVDHYMYNGELYGVVIQAMADTGRVCIFMCQNGGLYSLYFGRMVGRMEIDLSALATVLNTMSMYMYALITTSHHGLDSSRVVVTVSSLIGAIAGFGSARGR